MFKSRQFSVTGYSVWFRERYYQQEILHEVEDENGEMANKRAPREKYIKIPIQDWEKPFKPKQKGDLLYGFELVISGPCVFLSAKSETGTQAWNFGENDERIYLIRVEDKTEETPKLIHRSESYKKQKSMRKVDVNKEKNYFIRLKSGKSKEPLEPWLEDRMMEQLVKEVENVVK
jgi:hypothetical protein